MLIKHFPGRLNVKKKMSVDKLWLIIFILMWVYSVFYFWKREKRFSANILILLSYAGYSLISYLYYESSYPEYKGLSLFPFIFLFIMVLIAMRPVTNYCLQKDLEIAEPSFKAMNSFLIVWGACSIFAIIKFLPELRSGLFLIMTEVAAGQELYDETMSGAAQIGDGTSFANLPIIFSNVFADIGTLLTFYYITRREHKRKYAIILLIAILAPIFQSIAISQRGPAVDRLYSIAVSYMLFRPYYSESVKRVVRIGTIALVSVFVVLMTAITVSRFGQQSDEGAQESVLAYVGMENLNFNKYAFDNNGLRYGDRTAPIFKRLLGFSNVPTNFVERWKKYPHLKIDDGLFIGFVGDFLLDYGPIVSFILFVVFSTLFFRKTVPKKNKIEIHQLILVQFAACVCMCGGMKLFSFADLGNLKIIAVVIAYLYFKYTTQQARYLKKNIERELL